MTVGAILAEGAPFPGWRAHPEVDLVVLVAGITCWWASRRLAPRLHPDGPAFTGAQRWRFWGGLALLWAFASWPVHDVGEDHLFWVHMLQHTVFAYVAPLLLLVGLPAWLVGWLAELPVLRQLSRTLARPIPACVLFNVLTIVLHARPLVDGATTSAPLHFGVHLVLFTSAMCFWFPIVNPVDAPGLPRLSGPRKMLYLMVNTFFPVVPVVFLGLASKPTYEHYATAPRLAGFWELSPLDDQQLAAGAMWTLTSFWMIGCITVVFFQWWRAEQRDPSRSSLPEHIRRRPLPTR